MNVVSVLRQLMMFFGILPTRVQSPVALTEIQDWLAGRYLQIEVGFKRYYYYTEQVLGYHAHLVQAVPWGAYESQCW